MADLETAAKSKSTFAESAAPGTPSSGQAVVYVKTDGKLYLKDDAGTETDLTSGGSVTDLGDLGDVTVSGSETDGQVLTSDGAGGFAFEDAAGGGMSNPMTTSQDIIVGGASGTPGRLAVGSEGQVLTVSSGNVAWAAASGGASAIDDLSDVDTDKSKTPADGDVLTFDGTDWTAETPAAGGGTVSALGCLLENSGTQSISAATLTSVTFDTDVSDPSDMHSTVSNTSRITVPETRRYLVHFSAYTPSDTGTNICIFKINGTAVAPATFNAGRTGGSGIHGMALLDLSAGDYVEAFVYCVNGVTIGDAVNANQRTTFSLQSVDNSSTAGVSTGTTFPGTPSTGDRYRRSDIDYLVFFYDGTRWLSEAVFTDKMWTSSQTSTGGFDPINHNIVGSRDVWLIRLKGLTNVASTNSGSAYWTLKLRSKQVDDTSADIASFDTSADSPSNWVDHTTTIGAVLDVSTYPTMNGYAEKTGSPGPLVGGIEVEYRIIAT